MKEGKMKDLKESLKELKTEDLKGLLKEIKEELERRESVNDKVLIILRNEFNAKEYINYFI